MLLLLRQGRISKWFSGIGQEAVSVGAASAMDPSEWILPVHRNLGVFTTRGMTLEDLFLQWQGYTEGYSRGRERSFHFGSPQFRIFGMISHLGPQLSIADGIALAAKLAGEKKATLVFTGEGGTSEGEFHEALNIASVWDLPVVFLVENNGYALSTPTSRQYRCARIADKAPGYGMEAVTVDGNDLLGVYRTIGEARAWVIREQRPLLVECMTFRMRGHEEASGTRYVPAELIETWKQRDPVTRFGAYLRQAGVMSEEQIAAVHQQLKTEIDATVQPLLARTSPPPSLARERGDVFAPAPPVPAPPAGEGAPEKKFVRAISEGLDQAMDRFPRLVMMGQDIGAYGGAFKVTEGLEARYGAARVRDTPLCESAVVGAAMGLAAAGFKAMVEMQFADFVTCAFNQVVNNLAKIHYRWQQPADVVIRMPTGGSVTAGPFHSQNNEAWFMHTPGLKVVYPSTPYDAKGLLLAAVEDPNPVLYFEHKALYRSISGPVPELYYTLEIGRARRVRSGEEATIITYGLGVHWALQYARSQPDLSLNILDLRTLAPLDYEAIGEAVRETGKVLVLHEDTLTAGAGAEIAAWVAEHCFEWLDAPVMRCGSLDTPVPFAPALEKQFLADSRLAQVMGELINY
jgi:2-oxoisovalerate dehydrogenase E1 component